MRRLDRIDDTTYRPRAGTDLFQALDEAKTIAILRNVTVLVKDCNGVDILVAGHSDLEGLWRDRERACDGLISQPIGPGTEELSAEETERWRATRAARKVAVVLDQALSLVRTMSPEDRIRFIHRCTELPPD